MDLKEQDLLGEAVDSHWYYTSKAAAVQQMLRGRQYRNVLDVGAGSGFFTRFLLERTGIASGLCLDTSYAADRDEEVAGKPLRFRRSAADIDADLALFMDVLEHVDDDAGLLRDYAAKLPDATHYLLTVPAFPFLWSGHDVFLEHRRRYTRATLERTVRAAGLVPVEGCYFFALVFPIAAVLRLTRRLLHGRLEKPESQLRKHHPAVNALLSGLCRLELPLFRWNRLAGLSVFCLARKPGS